jgi:hypothetical protein
MKRKARNWSRMYFRKSIDKPYEGQELSMDGSPTSPEKAGQQHNKYVLQLHQKYLPLHQKRQVKIKYGLYSPKSPWSFALSFTGNSTVSTVIESASKWMIWKIIKTETCDYFGIVSPREGDRSAYLQWFSVCDRNKFRAVFGKFHAMSWQDLFWKKFYLWK